MYHDANPFQYVRALDQIQYYPHFGYCNPILFKPEHRELLDAERVAQHTTWTRDGGPELNFVTPPEEESKEKVVDDRIDLVFTAAMWQYRQPNVHIGVYNSHP